MKISSNFQEYYDSLRATDEDPDPLYVRLTKQYWLSLTQPPPSLKKYVVGSQEDENQSRKIRGYRIHFATLYGTFSRWMSNREDPVPDWFQRRVIGFCGRVYPVVSVGLHKNQKHAYNPERARKLVQEFNPEPNEADQYDLKTFRDTLKTQKRNLLASMDRNFETHFRAFQFQEWTNLLNGTNNHIGDDAFRHFRAPVLMADVSRPIEGNIPILITNPQLKNFDFVQVFTPQQAYQELSMYIGNNLAGLDSIEPRPISDKLRSETKGFDKWSFKNQKNRKVSDRGDW